MRRWVLLLALLLAAPAWAIDTNRWPHTIVDQACTDSYDTPTATTPTLVGWAGHNPSPAAQTSGSGDGYCDNDSRIATGAITSSTVFGPFKGRGLAGLIIWFDVTVATGGNTGYELDLQVARPNDGTKFVINSPGAPTPLTGAQEGFYSMGIDLGTPNGDEASDYKILIPSVFYIGLTLNTATSVTGDVSLTAWGTR